jgi:hypothetical protein
VASGVTRRPSSDATLMAGRTRLCHNRRVGRRPQEETMAKGQMRNSKEAKKPKSDKPKSTVSEYKKSQGASGQALNQPGKKS